MMNEPKFKAFEDSASHRLSLAVFAPDGACEYFRTGLEANEQLRKDIENIRCGQNPAQWSNNCTRLFKNGNSHSLHGTPQSLYHDLIQSNPQQKVIADQKGIYPNAMSQSAKNVFLFYGKNFDSQLDKTGCFSWEKRDKQLAQGAQRLLKTLGLDRPAHAQKTLDSVLAKLQEKKGQVAPPKADRMLKKEEMCR